MAKGLHRYLISFACALCSMAETAPLAATPPQNQPLALIFDADAPQEWLYRYYRKSEKVDGVTRIVAEFKDRNANLHASEVVEITSNEVRYALEVPQRSEASYVQLIGQKVQISHTVGGKTSQTSEQSQTPFVVGPMLVDEIKEHWDELEEQRSIHVRMVVPDRVETFGFKFVRGDVRNPDLFQVLFKPSNLLISALVSPVQFTFDKKSKNLRRIEGNSFLKKKSPSGEWVDFKAVFDFLLEPS